MGTSKKLANRTYPGLQELYFRLWKWTDTNFSPITLDHQLSFLSKYKRKELYRRSFQSLASILEQLLAMDDTSSGLSADRRITLRTALGNPQHFAAVILQHFYELQLLLQLFDTKQLVDGVDNYYGTLFTYELIILLFAVSTH